MATLMIRPCQRIRVSRPDSSAASITPTAADAVITPVVVAPPPRYTSPTAGNRTRGDEVSMATRSTANVMRTFFWVPR